MAAFDPNAMQADDRDDDEDEMPKSFEEMFRLFMRLKEPQSDGTIICLTASNRWMKYAKIIDGIKVTETDTGVAFYKFKRRAITFEQYLIFLQDLCDTKGLDFQTIKAKMSDCGDPRRAKGPKGKKNEFISRRASQAKADKDKAGDDKKGADSKDA